MVAKVCVPEAVKVVLKRFEDKVLGVFAKLAVICEGKVMAVIVILEVVEIVGGDNVVVASGILEVVEVSCEYNVLVEASLLEVLEVVGEDEVVVLTIWRLLFCVVMVVELFGVGKVVLVFAELKEIQSVREYKVVIAVCVVEVVGCKVKKEEVVVATTKEKLEMVF